MTAMSAERLLVHSGEQYDPADHRTGAAGPLGQPASSPRSTHAIPDHGSRLDGTIPLTFDRHGTAAPRRWRSTSATPPTPAPPPGRPSPTATCSAMRETLTVGAAHHAGGDRAPRSRRPGYNFNVTFTQPDWLRRDQSLTYQRRLREGEPLRLQPQGGARRACRSAASCRTSGAHPIRRNRRAGACDAGRASTAILRAWPALPLGLTYDSTGPDGLFNPTHGIKAKLVVTPTAPFGGNSSFFTLIQAQRVHLYQCGRRRRGAACIALRGHHRHGAGRRHLPDSRPTSVSTRAAAPTAAGLPLPIRAGPLFPEPAADRRHLR